MKICSNCKQEKSLEDFHRRKQGGCNSNCKACAILISKKWYAKNRHQPKTASRLKDYYTKKQEFFKGLVDTIKGICGCAACNEKEPCCLDFHHVFGEKENEISYFVRSKSIKKIASELKKCVCVCSNCHRKIHAGILILDEEVKTIAAKTLESQLYQVK